MVVVASSVVGEMCPSNCDSFMVCCNILSTAQKGMIKIWLGLLFIEVTSFKRHSESYPEATSEMSVCLIPLDQTQEEKTFTMRLGVELLFFGIYSEDGAGK